METSRLVFRHWRDDDAEALFPYASDPEVGPRAGWPPHKSVEDSLEAIHKYFSGESVWAIVLKETGEIIGCVGYHTPKTSNMNLEPDEVEVGSWVARPYWNQGFSSEALGRVIEYCRELGTLSTVYGEHFIDNPASGRMMEKLGFVDTGIRKTCPALEVGADKEVRVLKLSLK